MADKTGLPRGLPTGLPCALDDFAGLSGDELDTLFRRSPPGAAPHGSYDGIFLVMPGTPVARPFAALMRGIGWQGKIFDVGSATLVNRVSPFGISAVRARVYLGASRFDGKPCHILDYSTTSLVARAVRDEIREVVPGLRLGLAYWHGIRAARFALAFPHHGT